MLAFYSNVQYKQNSLTLDNKYSLAVDKNSTKLKIPNISTEHTFPN